MNSSLHWDVGSDDVLVLGAVERRAATEDNKAATAGCSHDMPKALIPPPLTPVVPLPLPLPLLPLKEEEEEEEEEEGS